MSYDGFVKEIGIVRQGWIIREEDAEVVESEALCIEKNKGILKKSPDAMEEYYFVYEGAGEFVFDDKVCPLKFGNYAYIPCNCEYTIKATSDEDFVLLRVAIHMEKKPIW